MSAIVREGVRWWCQPMYVRESRGGASQCACGSQVVVASPNVREGVRWWWCQPMCVRESGVGASRCTSGSQVMVPAVVVPADVRAG